jgi:hypothetical protein
MSKLLFLAAVAGLAISSVAQSPPPPSPTLATQNDRQHAGPERHDKRQANQPVLDQPTTHYKTGNNQDHQRNDETANQTIAKFTIVLAIVGFLQVGATVVQAIYMYKGLKLTRTAAKAAEDSVVLAGQNMHLDQRAWVAPNEVITERGSNQPLTVTILLKNTGKTFAKRCFVSSARTVKALTTDADPDFDTLLQNADKINLGIIAPSQEVPYTMNATFEGNVPNVVRLIFGEVTYTDVFNYPHWTTFCYRILESSLGGAQVERYTSYNNAH